MLIERIVDNRVFLLGLDKLYRDAMKTHERGELLACARRVAATLELAPASVPVEGYYAEEPALTEYFLLMRALQAASESRSTDVKSLPEFARLIAVTSSPIFGKAVQGATLLPTGRDPLSQALLDTWPGWTLTRLVTAAHDVATSTDDISLVGLAAHARDAIVLAATRETMVLYAQAIAGARTVTPQYEYIWRVDEALADAARRFVETFNALFNERLPSSDTQQAATYWAAAQRNQVIGRCVRLGYDDTQKPVRHYHWAIYAGSNGAAAVHEFWNTEVWTTERYAAVLKHSGGHPNL